MFKNVLGRQARPIFSTAHVLLITHSLLHVYLRMHLERQISYFTVHYKTTIHVAVQSTVLHVLKYQK